MSYEDFLEYLDIEWVRFAAMAGGGLIVGLFISNIVSAIGRRSKRKMVKDSAKRLSALVFVICFVLGLRFGLEAFDLELGTQILLSKVFVIVIYLLVTWAITRVYDVFHEQVLRPWGQRKENISVIDVLRTFAMALIWLLGTLSALSSAGYSVSAVLAGLGIGGLALALAAQDAVANIFGGVIILTQSPFKVGDKITIGSHTGWVLNIGLRSTLITNWYGNHVTIPNKSFTDSSVVNVDARTVYYEELPIKLRHDTSLEQAEKAVELIRELLDDDDDMDATHWVGVCGIGDGYIQIETWYGIKKFDGEDDSYPNEYMKILGAKSKLILGVLRAFEKESIHLAVPLERHIVSQTTEAPAETRFC